MDLLKGHPDITGEVVVQFDEGDFTEARDMRDLDDPSLQDLRVIATGLTIHLTPTRAEAIGPKKLVDFVYNNWARQRQTPRYPANWRFLQKYPYKSAVPAFSLITIVLTIIILPSITEPRQILGLLALIGLLLFLGWILYASNKSAFESTSWAVIQPLTAHEVREIEQTKNRVPLWALLVSLAGLAITSTFLVLNYFFPRK